MFSYTWRFPLLLCNQVNSWLNFKWNKTCIELIRQLSKRLLIANKKYSCLGVPLHVGLGHLLGKSLLRQEQVFWSTLPLHGVVQLALAPKHRVVISGMQTRVWVQQKPSWHWSLWIHFSHWATEFFGVQSWSGAEIYR